MHVVITQDGGQIRIEGQQPPEASLLLLAQALEILRVQVVAKAVAELPPPVEIATAMPNGNLGIRGGDVQLRKGRVRG